MKDYQQKSTIIWELKNQPISFYRQYGKDKSEKWMMESRNSKLQTIIEESGLSQILFSTRAEAYHAARQIFALENIELKPNFYQRCSFVECSGFPFTIVQRTGSFKAKSAWGIAGPSFNDIYKQIIEEIDKDLMNKIESDLNLEQKVETIIQLNLGTQSKLRADEFISRKEALKGIKKAWEKTKYLLNEI